jgi:4-amino-4-deoxy-L-arabinose transferase-like glycosyltransferase
MTFALTDRERRCLVGLIAVTVAVRLATLGAYPLMDSTESRYAEIARKMLETGNWLIPQFDYGVPFWGKPPLSTWLSAASMAVLGVNAFAARLPSLVLVGMCGALVYALAASRGGRDQALWTVALFVTTGLVFVSAGVVITDPALVFGTTLSMSGFWIAVRGPDRFRRRAACAFFAGIVVGLLANGPIALVLIFVPIGIATLASHSAVSVWRRVPWISGLAATAIVTAPWYWFAERASPGFLSYFLIGEHWKRFAEPAWTGDLYGSVLPRPRGMIWLFWIAAALPWSIGALAAVARGLRSYRSSIRAILADPWLMYFLLWSIMPMLFFTPAANITMACVLPGMPAFALLLGDAWQPQGRSGQHHGPFELRPQVRDLLIVGALLPMIFLAVIVAMHRIFETERSHAALVRDFEASRNSSESHLVYFRQRPQSAEFYTRGKALEAATSEALQPYFDNAVTDYFAIRLADYPALPADDRAKLDLVGTYGEYRLLRDRPR